MNRWMECIPNFSEGRDGSVISRIRRAISSPASVCLLDSSSDADHNRSVFTVAGPAAGIHEAILRAAAIAVEQIDLRKHAGVHPRIGALDVVPLVPLEGAAERDCIVLARKVADTLWNRFRLPSYFYGAAAARPDRRRLEEVRRGGFERLCRELPSRQDRWPDVGGPQPHPSAGAVAIGVRKPLIAWNVDLETADAGVARQIARAIRESSGGLPCVKALGLFLEARRRTQVSMNLTDFETTPLHVVYRRIEHEARRRGTQMAGLEIIGLVPRKAVEQALNSGLPAKYFRADRILEEVLEKCISERNR